MYLEKRSLNKEIVYYQKKIEDIKNSSEKLKEEIANADNKEYLEKIAYEQGMMKAGERGVVFIMPEEEENEIVEKKNILQRFSLWISKMWQPIKDFFND